MMINTFEVDKNGDVFLNGIKLPLIQSYSVKSGTVSDRTHEVTIVLKANVDITSFQDKACNNR